MSLAGLDFACRAYGGFLDPVSDLLVTEMSDGVAIFVGVGLGTDFFGGLVGNFATLTGSGLSFVGVGFGYIGFEYYQYWF